MFGRNRNRIWKSGRNRIWKSGRNRISGRTLVVGLHAGKVPSIPSSVVIKSLTSE